MNIRDARQVYGGRMEELNGKRQELARQKKNLEDRRKAAGEAGKGLFTEEAAILELSHKELENEASTYDLFMNKLWMLESGIRDMESSKQAGEAVKERYEDMAKCLTVARRIAHGDIVPATDEKKLMEFDFTMYMSAKNLAVLRAREEERKEYDTLWPEEEEKESVDPEEKAENSTVPASMETMVSGLLGGGGSGTGAALSALDFSAPQDGGE